MPRVFDLKTRVEQVQTGSSNPCGICQRQFAKYTCPSCNLQYCSLVCYRAEAHSECTETFYKSALAEEIKSQPAKTEEEKRQMLELLKRFEEESLEDEESDEEDGLVSRLEGIDLGKVDHDTLWGLLSDEERHKFNKMLMDPNSEDSQRLLNASNLLETREDPWWTLDNPPQDALPALEQVPSSMLAGKFNHLLLFNVFHLSLTYAYAVRTFAVSSLLTQASNELEEVREFILPLSPFLHDRKSTTLFSSVDSVVTDWASRLPELPSPKLLKVLMEDSKQLFHVRPVVAIESNPSSKAPIHDRCMRFLSDVYALFNGAKKYTHITHKLIFYLAFLVNLPPLASKELIGAVEAWEVRHPDDKKDTSQLGDLRPRTLVEEI